MGKKTRAAFSQLAEQDQNTEGLLLFVAAKATGLVCSYQLAAFTQLPFAPTD